MNMTDPIADMLTRIRNGLLARHQYVLVPGSKMKIAIARILKEEGFIKDVEILRDNPQRTLKIWLKYANGKEPVLSGLRRVSRPGLRVYTGKRELPRVLGGLGLAILSTPKGIMTERKARRLGVGGEILCYVW
ncbi:MAG: 30S ribosomal protein S8 [Chloroflexi bacterium]|nr:30S ribosomal protein S8 [Chloroflexota bacterium]